MSFTKKSKQLKWIKNREKMEQGVITFERFSQALLKKELSPSLQQLVEHPPKDDGPICA